MSSNIVIYNINLHKPHFKLSIYKGPKFYFICQLILLNTLLSALGYLRFGIVMMD